MPRRIRLEFEAAEGRVCGITGDRDAAVVVRYRSKRYGADYSEGFRHPLTPHYRSKASDPTRLAVHAQPGGVGYRLWAGMVVSSTDGLREPAQVVGHWESRRARNGRFLKDPRLHAFGYDVVSMKPRGWVEGEMALWRCTDAGRTQEIKAFVRCTVAAAGAVAHQLVLGVKLSRRDRPKDARGEYGFVGERLYRETEAAFHAALARAQALVEADADSDDPTIAERLRWMDTLRGTALALFDEYAPMAGLEDRNMARHVSARHNLSLTLQGRGKQGREVFEKHLDIPAPEPRRRRPARAAT